MNCDNCWKECAADFVTAHCTYHYFCSTCTAVFLDGLAKSPVCQKCVAKEVYQNFIKSREGGPNYVKQKPQKLKLSSTKLAPIQEAQSLLKPPTVTSSNSLTQAETDSPLPECEPDILDELTKPNVEKPHAVKYEQQNTSTTVPYTSEKGNVIYKIDVFTGKMVRFFPYVPKKIKDTSETMKQKFEKLAQQEKADVSTSLPLTMNIPSNSSSGADMQYIDHLFSFLREEKSKRQKFAVPSIKSRYHPDELEFNVKTRGDDFTTYPKYEANTSKNKQPNAKAPVLKTLLNQVKADTDDEVNEDPQVEQSSTPPGETSYLSNQEDRNYNIPLLLGRSASPASDVKGEYGSEDDKISLSSNSSDPTGPQNDDNDQICNVFPAPETTEVRSRTMLHDGRGYNTDEEERCSSPQKGISKLRRHSDYEWSELETSGNEIPTLPEPPRNHKPAMTSSSEEDSAEYQGLNQDSSAVNSMSQQNLQFQYGESSLSLESRNLSKDKQAMKNNSLNNVFNDDDFWDQ